MTRSERFFLVVQRTANVLVLMSALAFMAMLAIEWFQFSQYEREFGGDTNRYGGKSERKLPYAGQQIETAEGSLISIMQHDGHPEKRIELGGITITNPTTGKFIEVAPGESAQVGQFELIFDQGEAGKVVGYLAMISTPEQYEQGQHDLVVGALPAMTRNVVARNVRYSDLPRIRGDGSIGLLMWPAEDEAHLVAIRLSDGAIVERVKVSLPRLRENRLSQGRGSGYFALGGQGRQNAAPVAAYPLRDTF